MIRANQTGSREHSQGSAAAKAGAQGFQEAVQIMRICAEAGMSAEQSLYYLQRDFASMEALKADVWRNYGRSEAVVGGRAGLFVKAVEQLASDSPG